MNRDYQKFGKYSYYRATRHLSYGDDLLPEAFRCLWEVYENFLNSFEIRHPENDNIRNRNTLFAKLLKEISLYDQFVDTLFGLRETILLAELQPRIYHEETYHMKKTKDTKAHDAFSSDFARFIANNKCKNPITRLLNLLYIVRCNLDHGQKGLPDEWPQTKERNAIIFSLTVPILKKFAELLFENIWADGLFVYGTCKPDEGNFVHIRQVIEDYSSDWYVDGLLYNLGSYPGFVHRSGSKVKGYVLKANNLFAILRLMDDLEGSDFTRNLIWARSSNPEIEPALTWIYCYNKPTEEIPPYRHEEWHSK